jgi:hypothetical protein
MELLFFQEEPAANHLEAGRAASRSVSAESGEKITGQGVSTVQRVKLALAKVERACRAGHRHERD